MVFDSNEWIYHQRGVRYCGDLAKAKRLSAAEVKAIFKWYGRKAFYLRNPYDFDCKKETDYWYIVGDHALEIENYRSAKVRTKIRKSLKTYDFRIVDMAEMERHGYKVFCENWQRFPRTNRPKLMHEDEFKKYLLKAESRGVEFWMGYSTETGEAAMWATLYEVGGFVYGEEICLSRQYTQHYPTYGLHHELLRFYLKEKGLKCYLSGARSATQHSNIQEFLIENLEFRKAYCRLQVPIRFPYNVIVAVLLPFQKLVPRTSRLRALLRLKSCEC